MSLIPPPSGHRPRSSSEELATLGQAAFRFGAEAWGQWWTIMGRNFGREAKRFVQGAMASTPPAHLLRGLAGGYVNCLSELAAIAPSVAEKTAMDLTRRPHAHLEPYIGAEDAGPEVKDEYFEVNGKPFAMPARVLDASQGWAMYFVPTKAANDSLGTASKFVSAFDAGGGRTPLTIIGVDYRNSDFGCYPEFVVALTVTAKDDSAGQLFAYYLAIVVTQEFTKEAARIVWGLEKTLCPKLAVRYAADETQFGLPGRALSIRFPRFGAGRSSDVPTFSISRPGEGSEKRIYWALTTKSGSGEGMQIGGSVKLQLGVARDGECVCSDGKSACLCETLRAFDIADRLPAANGWTERQTAAFGAPRLLDLPE